MSEYKFKGELWKYDGPAGWCFVTLSAPLSKKVRSAHAESEEGWGRLKTTATIGDTTWETAIWFDTKRNSYLLPVKTLIRQKENLAIGTVISGKILF